MRNLQTNSPSAAVSIGNQDTHHFAIFGQPSESHEALLIEWLYCDALRSFEKALKGEERIIWFLRRPRRSKKSPHERCTRIEGGNIHWRVLLFCHDCRIESRPKGIFSSIKVFARCNRIDKHFTPV